MQKITWDFSQKFSDMGWPPLIFWHCQKKSRFFGLAHSPLHVGKILSALLRRNNLIFSINDPLLKMPGAPHHIPVPAEIWDIPAYDQIQIQTQYNFIFMVQLYLYCTIVICICISLGISSCTCNSSQPGWAQGGTLEWKWRVLPVSQALLPKKIWMLRSLPLFPTSRRVGLEAFLSVTKFWIMGGFWKKRG